MDNVVLSQEENEAQAALKVAQDRLHAIEQRKRREALRGQVESIMTEVYGIAADGDSHVIANLLQAQVNKLRSLDSPERALLGVLSATDYLTKAQVLEKLHGLVSESVRKSWDKLIRDLIKSGKVVANEAQRNAKGYRVAN